MIFLKNVCYIQMASHKWVVETQLDKSYKVLSSIIPWVLDDPEIGSTLLI